MEIIMTFINTFIEKYYLPPVGVTPENKCFSVEHIVISAILFFFIIIIFTHVTEVKSKDYSTKVLNICAASMLLLEIFRISWNAYYHGFSLSSFRFDFCNQICMFLPFCVFFGGKKIYPYVQLLAITGGLIVLIYPLWVFYDYAGFHIMALQSMVSHGLMLLCGLIMPFASGEIPTRAQQAKDSLIGFSVVLVIAFIMSHLTGVNYLIMKSADGVPFIGNIPAPWYWLIILPLTYVLAWVLSNAYIDLICVVLHIPLDSRSIYHTDTVGPKEYQKILALQRFKYFRPFKYYRACHSGGKFND